MQLKPTGRVTDNWLNRSMSARQYFSFTVLFFIAAFLLLPTSKLVNNFFYLLIAIPAIVYLLRHRQPFRTATHIDYLFLAFLAYCFIFGLVDDPDFAKYCVYLLLFVLVISRLVEVGLFTHPRFARLLFWGLITYVLIAASIYALQGNYELGDRIVDLPSRLYGPIFTSIFIASSLVLLTPVWIRQQSYVEASAGITLALLCVAVILQSRTGLVGIALWAASISVWLAYKYKVAGVVLAIVTMTLALSVAGLLLVESDKLVNLYARADSGRFEIWQFFIASWYDCGLLKGCGLSFEMAHPVNGQTILHPHSIFVTLGVYLGLLPLLLFIVLMAAVLRLAVRQQNWWGGYLAMALLLSNLDGSIVVNSPNELWLLIWLPAGLILNQYLTQKQVIETGAKAG